MGKRILTAAIALPILIFIVWLGGLWLTALIAVVAGLGAWELCRLATACEKKPVLPLAVILAVVFAVSYHLFPEPRYPENMEFPAMFPALIAVLAAVNLTFMHRTSGRLGDTLATLSIAMVLGGTLFHAPLLRDFDLFSRVEGRSWFIFLLGVTFAGDAVAYLTDKAIGSHNLTADRTWKGAIGGVLGAVVFGVFLSSALALGVPAPVAAFVSGILAIAGYGGAKFITKMKRMSGVENTGRLLPGYGGILDRTGSLMWSLVVLYHLVAFFSGSTS